MNAPARCPECGSENIEENDPRLGEHTCRDCNAPIYDEEAESRAAAALAAEMAEHKVASVSDYHDVCDANEAIDEHMTAAGLDSADLASVGRVCDLADAQARSSASSPPGSS